MLKEKKKRIALYGGAFNPIHCGHVALVKHMLEALCPDELLLMPTAMPPHKKVRQEDNVSGEQRLAMCRLAVRDLPGVSVSDFELRKGGVSYTVETLEAFHVKEPCAELILCMGGDMFLTVNKWYRAGDIFRLASLAGAARTEEELVLLRKKALELEALGARCRVFPFPVLELSSTQVREKLRSGGSLAGLLPDEVEAFVREKGLYR